MKTTIKDQATIKDILCNELMQDIAEIKQHLEETGYKSNKEKEELEASIKVLIQLVRFEGALILVLLAIEILRFIL